MTEPLHLKIKTEKFVLKSLVLNGIELANYTTHYELSQSVRGAPVLTISLFVGSLEEESTGEE